MADVNKTSNQNDFANVVAAALDYAFGVAEKDWARLQQAFDAPKAQMKLITGEPGAETVYDIPVEDVWKQIWSTLPDAPEHSVEITSVTIQHGRVAVVEMNNNDRFYDQLGLYKVNGQWKIYDKLTRMLDGGYIPEAELERMFGAQA